MWAVSTPDIKTELARLRKQGIATDGPHPGGRTRPDGQVIRWETAGIGPGTRGDLLPFLIQDHTAHSLRVQPSASVHGSGLSGIAVVVIGVKDLATSIALFRQAYGWEAPRTEEQKEFGARLAYFSGTPVMLASPRKPIPGSLTDWKNSAMDRWRVWLVPQTGAQWQNAFPSPGKQSGLGEKLPGLIPRN